MLRVLSLGALAAVLVVPPQRARDLGVVIGRYTPGRWDAITDVGGVRVGHVTLRAGRARTGVTVIVPGDGDLWREKRPAGSFVLNGNGEATGLMWLAESGILAKHQ
jgi:D-aminopeptidase